MLGLGIVAGGHREIGDVPVTVDTTYIRDISFRETPNLYFVSFDALAPHALLKKYLAWETAKFHDLFDINFRRFPNFFANAVKTKESLNTVLALDVDMRILHNERNWMQVDTTLIRISSLAETRLISLESFTGTATRLHQSM